jgi:hypothetical protein
MVHLVCFSSACYCVVGIPYLELNINLYFPTHFVPFSHWVDIYHDFFFLYLNIKALSSIVNGIPNHCRFLFYKIFSSLFFIYFKSPTFHLFCFIFYQEKVISTERTLCCSYEYCNVGHRSQIKCLPFIN